MLRRISFGNKLVQTSQSTYFLGSNQILTPYSLLSIVQHYQKEVYDGAIERFFTQDYYKLNGQT